MGTGLGTASARDWGLTQGDSGSWGQGRAPTPCAGQGLHATHALTIVPVPGGAVGTCSRPPTALGYVVPCCVQPTCLRAAGCQEGLLQLHPWLLRTRLCLCNLNLRWFGNTNDGCDGLRGSSRAAELGGLRACAALQRVRGAGGWNLLGQLPWGQARQGGGLWFPCLIGAAGVIATAVRERGAQRSHAAPAAALRFPRSVPPPAHEPADPRHCCSPTDGHCCGAQPRLCG